MPLSETLLARIALEYGGMERAAVAEALESYGAVEHEREPERVRGDILTLARGQLEEVLSLVARAHRDYRDILFWAEYPQQSRLDTPENVAAFQDMCRRFGASIALNGEKEEEPRA